MDRDLILEHPARAERQIASARKKITEQIEFIAWLSGSDKDATGAIALLREFEMRLAIQAPIENGSARNSPIWARGSRREQQARQRLTKINVPPLQSAV